MSMPCCVVTQDIGLPSRAATRRALGKPNTYTGHTPGLVPASSGKGCITVRCKNRPLKITMAAWNRATLWLRNISNTSHDSASDTAGAVKMNLHDELHLLSNQHITIPSEMGMKKLERLLNYINPSARILELAITPYQATNLRAIHSCGLRDCPYDFTCSSGPAASALTADRVPGHRNGRPR